MLSFLRKLWQSATGPSVPIRRPEGVSRRDFLRAMGVTSTTVMLGGMGSSVWKPEGVIARPGVPLTPNEVLFNMLASGNPDLGREAADAVNAFTRMKMREDGFYRRILPPIQITNDDLDREVDSAAAVSIPFDCLPLNLYIRGPRYRIEFDRIVTPKFTANVDELRTWTMGGESEYFDKMNRGING